MTAENPEVHQSDEWNIEVATRRVSALHREFLGLMTEAPSAPVKEFNEASQEITSELSNIRIPKLLHSIQFVFRSQLHEPKPAGFGIKSVDQLAMYQIKENNQPIFIERAKQGVRGRAWPLIGVEKYVNHQREFLAFTIPEHKQVNAIITEVHFQPEYVLSIKRIDTISE